MSGEVYSPVNFNRKPDAGSGMRGSRREKVPVQGAMEREFPAFAARAVRSDGTDFLWQVLQFRAGRGGVVKVTRSKGAEWWVERSLKRGHRHSLARRDRADRLLNDPPDPDFVEPGGDRYSRALGFSTVLENGPNLGLGTAEDYARAKASLFPNEGGAAILRLEVPSDIVDIIYADPISAASAVSGEIRFDPGYGLEELIAEWPKLVKQVRAV